MIALEEALERVERAHGLQLDGRHPEALDCLEPAVAYFAENDGPQSPDRANLLLDQA
jgi:hypothetical protein